MRHTIIAAGAAAILLAGCTKSGPPPKPQPGSWTTKFEILKMEGKDAEKARPAMDQMFAMMSSMSVCMTPELAAQDDPTKGLDRFGGGNGNCTWDKKEVSAAGLHLSGTCKNAGKTVKITADGTLSATDKDVTMTIDGYDAAGAKEGTLQFRSHAVRTGDCKPGDMRPPAGNAM